MRWILRFSASHGGRRQDANKYILYMESGEEERREEKGEAPAIKWHSRDFFVRKKEREVR